MPANPPSKGSTVGPGKQPSKTPVFGPKNLGVPREGSFGPGKLGLGGPSTKKGGRRKSRKTRRRKTRRGAGYY
jgi:hypothetical protein